MRQRFDRADARAASAATDAAKALHTQAQSATLAPLPCPVCRADIAAADMHDAGIAPTPPPQTTEEERRAAKPVCQHVPLGLNARAQQHPAPHASESSSPQSARECRACGASRSQVDEAQAGVEGLSLVADRSGVPAGDDEQVYGRGAHGTNRGGRASRGRSRRGRGGRGVAAYPAQ
uniref:Uncharacterized protein n=1 Tax=Chrysotila carterae TaxID=13221 RepID=A0A7S4C1F3_CHRCT